MFCCNAAQGVSSPSPEMATTSALHTNNLRPALSTSPQATIARAALPIEGQIWLAQRYAVDHEQHGTLKPSAMSSGPNISSKERSQVLASSEVRASGTRKRRMITPSTIATAMELIPMRYAPVPSPSNTPKSIATITGPRTEETMPTVT
jgi:hypothetical protein